MDDLKELNELRQELDSLFVSAKAMTRFLWDEKTSTATTIPESERCVLIYDKSMLASCRLQVCWRSRKPSGAIEIFHITRVDRSKGPTASRFDMYLNKLVSFLEARGLYHKRDVITDKTGDLFQ